MDDRVVTYRSTKELQADLCALKLRIAFQQEIEAEAEELSREKHHPDEAIVHMAAEADARIRACIRRALRKNVGCKSLKLLVRAGRIAAAALLVFFIGLSTAIATVPQVRVRVLNFFLNMETQYTEMGLLDTGRFVEIPFEWRGSYFPAWLPERFALVSATGGSVSYTDADGKRMDFCEYGEGSVTNIDTENADVSFREIGGQSVMVIEKRDFVTLVWSGDNRYFILSLQGSREEALQIQQSIIMIK